MDMAGNAVTGHTSSLTHFILYRLLPLFVLLAAGATILFAAYISTPHAAAKLSTILSDKLDLPVTIRAIRLQGDTLTIQGINVGNPAGFAEKNLMAVAAVSVAPSWTGLLQGRRKLRLLDISGAELDLEKGGDGAWNFTQLSKKFSGGKGGAELFIDNLRVNDAKILFNGKDFSGISLQLKNLATKGSGGANLDISFADEAANRYRLTGNFRAGADPEAEFSLEAPSLSLAGLTRKNRQVAVTSGRGSLQGKAALQAGVVTATVAATVNDGKITLRNGETVPLSGNLQGSVRYDLKDDALQLESLTLFLDRLVNMQASGSADSLKSDLSYDLTLAIASLDLGQLRAMVPAMQKSAMKTAGRISAEKIRIAGNRERGVTRVAGVVSLRDLLLSSKDRLLFNGIGTDMKIATVGNSIRLTGELTQKPAGGKPLLESIRAPYSVNLGSTMNPKNVELRGFSAMAFGAPLSGNFTLRPADKNPLALSLKLPSHQLKEVTYGDISIAGGAAALSLELTGSGSANFSGSASLDLDNLQGSNRGERYTLGKATVSADFSSSAGQYQARGNAAFDRALFKSVAADGHFAFRAADEKLQLENGAVTVAGTTVNFTRLMAVIPGKTALQAKRGYPLDVTLSGGAVSRGEIKLSGIAAFLRGDYGGAKKFSGNGEILAEKLLWRGRNIGAPGANLAVTPAEAKITLAGTILGGKLGGKLSGNPNALAKSVEFDLSLHEADLAKVMKLADKTGAVALSGGRLTIASKGSYARKSGVNCRIQGYGDRIAAANTKGKELFGNGSVSFDATLAEENITLTEAVVRPGEGAAVRLKGAVAKALSPQRNGIITYNMDRTPLERLTDPLVNSLPRFLQEAAVSGNIASEGSLALHNGRASLQGSLLLDGTGIDAGPNKLQVTDISGSIPFILAFPAQRTASPQQTMVLKRPLYAQQLAQFSKEATKGSLLKIGRIAFGPLEFSDTSLRITAAEGIIEALSFTSSLTTGKILGRGYVAFSQEASYGGDLLVNNLSLERLCALFPGIRGYVSGRVDGIAMVEGRGGKIDGVNGYTHFWTREGNGEKMLVSREFLQKLAGKNLKGFFFRHDRPFDKGEVMASLEAGYLTFDILDIENTNFFGVRDLKVSVTETQNRIALEHLLSSISQAVSRGKGATGKGSIDNTAPPPAFKWDE